MNNSVGDLVYIPSDTSLMRLKEGTPSKVIRLEKPKYLLVCEEKDSKLGVDFQGDVWYVEKRQVYNV